MKSLRGTASEQGEVNALLVSLILLSVLFIGVTIFGVWAFSGRQDYKNNSDTKVAAAIAADKQAVQVADAKQYAEAAKNPVITYAGPDAYGSVHISYPKTWSAYVDTSGAYPLDAYFHPGYVPSTQSKQTYNLRVRVATTTYDQQLNQYTTFISNGNIKAAPYSLPKVPSVTGIKLSGAIIPGNQKSSGTMVLIPLRDKTLEIWTESNDYLADFEKYVLPNLTFVP
ncbi:MAG TPA: hypothetical protein VLG92_05980 [Candidatus Saccharimonadia bacterium]|nr:hypothetical protein [Candidatus Saccharimonadia bacterium]